MTVGTHISDPESTNESEVGAGCEPQGPLATLPEIHFL